MMRSTATSGAPPNIINASKVFGGFGSSFAFSNVFGFFVGDATTTRLSLALSGAFLLNLVGVMVSGAVVKRESDTFFND
jgi:hypothetical protein